MNEGSSIDDELLAKHIAGEATAAERAQVQAWAAASPKHARELERMRAVWDWSGDGADLPEVDTEGAWQRVRTRIDEASSGGRVVPMWTHARRWLAAAAVVAGLVFAARWWVAPRSEVYMADTAYRELRLSDSSTAVLSPGSRLAARMGAAREVELTGEAYFEVHHDASRPFVISAGELEVTVLGTEFTVSAYDTAHALGVRVRGGRVRVVAGRDTLVLTAGQHARYDRRGHRLERRTAPPMEAWGDRILQFEDASLGEVVLRLEQLFAVRIELGNARLARCRLTATFEQEPIERILEVIAETYGLTVTRAKDNSYVLQGDGCD